MKVDCPFCNSKVVDIAFAKESNFYAVYNHAPIVQGHCMIIPFEHHEDILSLNDEEYTSFFLFARKVTRFLNQIYTTHEFDWSIQQGKNAGQSVPHLHLHIIPRKAKDLPEGEEWYHKLNEDEFTTLDSNRFLKDEELNQISDSLRKQYNAQYLDKE